MSFEAWITEAKSLTLKNIHLASTPMRWMAVTVWIILCLSTAHHFIFSPSYQQRTETKRQQTQVQNKIQLALSQIETQEQKISQEAQKREAWLQLRKLWGGLADGESAISVASDLAKSHSLKFRIELSQPEGSVNSGTQVPTVLSAIFDSIFYRIELTGPLPSLMYWLHQLLEQTSQGRGWLADATLEKSDLSAQTENGVSELYTLRASLNWLGVMGLNRHDIGSDSVMISSSLPPVLESGFGIGTQSSGWWQALPIERLSLVGLGEIDDVRFAWIVDPTGQLHTVKAGMVLGQGRWRVDSVGLHSVWIETLGGNEQTMMSLNEWSLGEP